MKIERIQFITHATPRYTTLEGARLALEGGCRWIQLRMKDASDGEVAATAQTLGEWCRRYGATMLLDDRVNLCLQTGADGVHLGKTDMPIDEARRLTGEEFIIGGTANTADDIRRIARQGGNYIGCGPFRFTTTKKNLSPVLGTEGYRQLCAMMKAENIGLPLIAIGGIVAGDIGELMQAGIHGIAVSGASLNSASPSKEMEHIINLISKYEN